MVSREQWEEDFRNLPKEERIKFLHYTLVNIDREFLEEYMELSEEEVEEIVKEQ